jgi:hypothetical protein
MISDNIQAVVNQLVTPTGFVYGTKDEMNVFLDKVNSFPVVLLYPLKPIEKNETVSYAINDKFSIYLEFLYKTTFDMYTSQNEVFIDLANNLVNEFLIKLDRYRISADQPKFFVINVNDKRQSLPVYNKFDANLTGVNLTLSLTTMTNTGYDPNSRPPGWVAGPYG